MIAIGSGGSFSVATLAGFLHEFYTGFVGRAATPLEYLAMPRVRASVICFSASGRNRDIATAFKAAAQNEAGPVGALVMESKTPIHALQTQFSYANVAEYADSTIKDGFLAVSSLVASATLLIRAYETVLGQCTSLPDDMQAVASTAIGRPTFDRLSDEVMSVVERHVVSVLYTPNAKPAAVDLESRFVEAALGALHVADLRNFGHGRHHWMAKREFETGVLMLIGDNLGTLADRTMSLLPPETTIARIDLNGPAPLQALAALITSLHVSEAAGRSAGIDPSKPGVPAFGRKLYRLGPGVTKKRQSELNLEAALRRKVPPSEQREPGRRAVWESAYRQTMKRLATTTLHGVVLDYDGTLCSLRKRFDLLSDEIGVALTRLVNYGCVIAIATGRGPSAGQALRAALPAACWDDVVVGYYNGGIVTLLADDRDLLVSCLNSDPLLEAFLANSFFVDAKIRANAVQISIRLNNGLSLQHAIEIARGIVSENSQDANVLASSHSIDIVRGNVSKLDVVRVLQSNLADPKANILRIGDKGAWPGNDSQLLDDPFGLSVDQVSSHMYHCWNLAPAGVIGVQASLYYLSRIEPNNRGMRLRIRSSDRGY